MARPAVHVGHLLDARGQHDVVRPRGHRQIGLAEGQPAGGAGRLHPRARDRPHARAGRRAARPGAPGPRRARRSCSRRTWRRRGRRRHPRSPPARPPSRSAGGTSPTARPSGSCPTPMTATSRMLPLLRLSPPACGSCRGTWRRCRSRCRSDDLRAGRASAGRLLHLGDAVGHAPDEAVAAGAEP